MVCYLHGPSLKTKGELERCPRRRRAPGTRYSRKTKIYFGPRWNCHSSWLQSRVFHSWFTQSALKNFSTFTLKINRSSTSYVVCGLFEGPGKKRDKCDWLFPFSAAVGCRSLRLELPPVLDADVHMDHILADETCWTAESYPLFLHRYVRQQRSQHEKKAETKYLDKVKELGGVCVISHITAVQHPTSSLSYFISSSLDAKRKQLIERHYRHFNGSTIFSLIRSRLDNFATNDRWRWIIDIVTHREQLSCARILCQKNKPAHLVGWRYLKKKEMQFFFYWNKTESIETDEIRLVKLQLPVPVICKFCWDESVLSTCRLAPKWLRQ